MDEPFDTRLDEAIIAEPNAVEPRRVLADFLEERGHPRAEHIRLVLARHDQAADRFLHEHADALVGMKLDSSIACTLLLGFADTLTLTNTYERELAEFWPVIARHRYFRFLRGLRVIRSDFRFDPTLPPPDAIRELTLYYQVQMVRSLERVVMPRVEKLVIDQHMQSEILDVGVLGPVFEHALPALAELEVVNCLDEATVGPLVELVLKWKQLRTLKLDRLSEAAARALLQRPPIALQTDNETISAKTRAELKRVVRQWQRGTVDKGGETTRSPRHAPADFATRAPVTRIAEGWITEYVGSGVTVHDHPMRMYGSSACGACTGTNNLVIWARSEVTQTAAGWGPDYNAITYELQCRDCGAFSVHHTTAS